MRHIPYQPDVNILVQHDEDTSKFSPLLFHLPYSQNDMYTLTTHELGVCALQGVHLVTNPVIFSLHSSHLQIAATVTAGLLIVFF